MRSELVCIGSCSILIKWLRAKRMRPTTTPEVITPLEKNKWTLPWRHSARWLITVMDYKAFCCSIHSGEELDQDSHPCSWRDYLWTMERSQNLLSPSTLHLRYDKVDLIWWFCLLLMLFILHRLPPQLWSPTMPYCILTQPWSIVMLDFLLTMRQSTRFVETNSTWTGQPTQT